MAAILHRLNVIPEQRSPFVVTSRLFLYRFYGWEGRICLWLPAERTADVLYADLFDRLRVDVLAGRFTKTKLFRQNYFAIRHVCNA